METIKYVLGDATKPNPYDVAIIAHVCNDIGGWGRGFVTAISRRWKAPEKAYRLWYKTGAPKSFELGQMQLVQVNDDLYVANMIAQRGIRTKINVEPAIRYDELAKCLKLLAEEALRLDASVHMPRIGCGLAGGTWEEVEPLILENLSKKNIKVIVYDFDGKN